MNPYKPPRKIFTMIFDIAWEFPPNYVGGLGVYQQELFPLLAEKFKIQSTALFRPEDEKHVEEINGIDVFRIKPEKKLNDTFNIFIPWNQKWFIEGGYYDYNLQSIELASSLKKVELVHSHDWLGMLAGHAISKHRKIPWVVTIHSLELGRNDNPNPWVVDIEKIGMNADKVIAVSHGIKDRLLEMGFPPEKVEVIYNGINTEKYDPDTDDEGIRKRFGLPEDKKIIFFVGRPVREKGIESLIDAFRKIREKRDDVILVLLSFGDIPEITEGVFQINRFVREEDRIRLITTSDIFVVPSLYEPFGIVTLEGMAMGKPVIGSHTGGIAEVIEDKKSGLLFETGNTSELAEKISCLLDNEKKAKKISRGAVRRAHQFSWENNAEKVTKIYKELLSEVTY